MTIELEGDMNFKKARGDKLSSRTVTVVCIRHEVKEQLPKQYLPNC